MQRILTAEERQILLDNPELVMFRPKEKSYWLVWVRLLAPSFIIFILGVLLLFLFPDVPFFQTNLYVGIWIMATFAPCVIIPISMATGKPGRRQQRTHYLRELKKALPKELMCSTVTVRGIVPQQAEIYLTVEGKEEIDSYLPYVNSFDLVKGTEVVIVYGKEFRAYIKRAAQTEDLYNDLLQ